ncbi:MAG: alcohol dehydrogenase catalytic domain-containing protein [Negativicutes bacterium]|nr:alcohol dehydrogenase catalytic domain-containing protein [Negativicutes bacterium]
MLQAVLKGPKNIEFCDVPKPEPGAGQVLVQVKRIGVCGSDIHVYHGKHKYATFPVVQGHEGSGVVVKTGPAVEDIAAGDLVTFRPQMFCGECLLCRQGRYNLCDQYKVIGVLGSTTGMASDYFLTDASKLHKLPPSMGADAGAMVEPAAVAYHSVKLAGDVRGGKVLIVGAGPIGNLVAQSAKALGAGKTMIVDINPIRLDLAKKCGVDFCVDTSKTDLETAILANFGPDRADVIIDCAGIPKILEQLVRNARRGSNIVLVGNYYDAVPVELGLVQRREINLVGVMNYTAPDYEDVIRLIAEGKIKVSELITNHFPLKDYTKAYDYIDANSNSVMKVLIDVSE